MVCDTSTGRLTKASVGTTSSYTDNGAVTPTPVMSFSVLAAAPNSVNNYYVRIGLATSDTAGQPQYGVG